MKSPNSSTRLSEASICQPFESTRPIFDEFNLSVRWLIAAVLLITQIQSVRAQNSMVKEVETNRMVEVVFTATNSYKEPFNEVTLDVVFKSPGGKEIKVPGFWAGKNTWKARY